jgi:hypothetical protein
MKIRGSKMRSSTDPLERAEEDLKALEAVAARNPDWVVRTSGMDRFIEERRNSIRGKRSRKESHTGNS